MLTKSLGVFCPCRYSSQLCLTVNAHSMLAKERHSMETNGIWSWCRVLDRCAAFQYTTKVNQLLAFLASTTIPYTTYKLAKTYLHY